MTTPETALARRIRQMADAWEQQLPDVIRTPAVVSALRATLEAAEPAACAHCGSSDHTWDDCEAYTRLVAEDATAAPAAASAAVAPPTTHGLSVQHADALWDAIATPGPSSESFADQHANVCRAVREILDDLLPAPTETTPSHRAGLRDEIVKALGRIETVPPVAHRREQADHVLAVLYREWPWLRAEAEDAEPTDRAAVLDLDAIAARAADAQQYGIEDDGFEQLVREDVPALITALRRMADETATETPEDPARIDRLRPEFTEHASVEAIDAQLDRARRQERRWHIRAEWLIGLRQARADEPAAGARQDGAET